MSGTWDKARDYSADVKWDTWSLYLWGKSFFTVPRGEIQGADVIFYSHEHSKQVVRSVLKVLSEEASRLQQLLLCV